MKKLNIQTIYFLLVVYVIFGIASVASANTAFLYVSPASANKKAGDTINTAIGINSGGNKIYAVEGTLAFDKLTCQSIAVSAGLQALTAPGCSSPHFLLGIPGGSTDNKTLLTITTKAGEVGTATISVTGVNIVGGDAVKSISNSGGSGSYAIEMVEAIKASEVGTAINNNTSTKTVTTKIEKKATDNKEEKIEGKVLAEFDQQDPNSLTGNIKCGGLFASNTDKIVIGFLISVIVLLVGFIIFKRKK